MKTTANPITPVYEQKGNLNATSLNALTPLHTVRIRTAYDLSYRVERQ